MMREWWFKLRAAVTGRRRIADELREEIDAHLELEIQDSVSRGMTPESARRQFGNRTLIQERAGEVWGFPAVEIFLHDLRYGLRMLRRSPGFAAVAVLSLALGIGANTAIFMVVDALMLRTLPVRDPAQLALFKRIETNGAIYNFSYPWFERFRRQSTVFSDVSGSWIIDRYNVRASGTPGPRDSEQVSVALASGNYFSNLGIQAAIGRTFSVDEDRVPGGHPVAVISYPYWERRFALAPDIAGRTLTLHGTTYTILGVTPRAFTGEWVGKPVDLWIPYAMASQVMPEAPGGPRAFPAVLLGRLKPGVPIQQAQAASQVIFKQIVFEGVGANPTPQHLQFLAARRLELEPGARGYSQERSAFALPLGILMSVVGVVLLIACANLANLLLARSAARQREMAVRLATGAGRMRLVRQLLTEAAVLAILGGTLGLIFAVWAAQVLMTMVAAGTATTASMALDIHPGIRVFGFTAGLSISTALLFGLAPAFRSSKLSLAAALTGRGPGAYGRAGLGKALVIAQVALTVVLLSGAGLFLRTLQNLRTQDLGFTREHLLLVWTSPSQTGRSGPALAALLATMQQRVSALPDVRSASISNGGILEGGDGGGPSEQTLVESQPPKPGLVLRFFAVAPAFFTTAGLPLLAGRDFTERDNETSPPVAIINQTMARFFFGSENPIGKRFGGPQGKQIQIVGVARNAKAGSPRDARGVWYVPYRQSVRVLQRPWCLVVRTAGSPTGAASRIREEIRNIDASLPVLRINTVEEQLADVLAQDRMLAALSGLFGAVAVLIACVGLYGVVSYATTRRTSEIGVRLAMGATRSAIVRMVINESLLLVAAGLALGLPISVAATRIVSARLFHVSPTDPLTFSAATALLLAVSAMAAFLPAWRSSKVDPMVALRCE